MRPRSRTPVAELERRQLARLAALVLRARSRSRAPGALGSSGLSRCGRVLEIALEVGAQPPAHAGRRSRRHRQRVVAARCRASAVASSSRARASAAGVQARGAASRAQPLERVLQRRVRERRRGRAARGRDRDAPGRAPLDEPAHRAADPRLQRGRRPDALAQLAPAGARRAAARSTARPGWPASAPARPREPAAARRRRGPVPALDGAQRRGARACASELSSNRSQTSSTNSERGRRLAVVVGDVPAEEQQLLGRETAA